MILAFYRVDNSLEYGRHSFDTVAPDKILEKIKQLPEEEREIYSSPEDFAVAYNDELLDGGWWCVTIPDPEEKGKTLEKMISQHAYDSIVSKVKEQVGEKAFHYIFPGIKKALEEGDGDIREKILGTWLDVDCVRVCTYCGKIMEEGWYLDGKGYACSDECAAKSEGITMEDFNKYRIYKDDILQYLKDKGDSRNIEDLSQEECDDILGKIFDNMNCYYTEWY